MIPCRIEPIQKLDGNDGSVKRARPLGLAIAAWSLAITAGCASFARDTAADQTLAIVERSVEAAAREPDLELARAAAPAGVIQLAAFAAQYPERPAFRARYADALCGYAIGFVFDDRDAAALAGGDPAAPGDLAAPAGDLAAPAGDLAAPAGDLAAIDARLGGLLERCVAANLARLGAADERGLDARLATLAPSDAPAVLWIASARAVALAMAPLRHLPELPRIEAMLARVEAVAPGLQDAAAEQLRGALAAGRPRFLAGDAGAAAFARARQRAPGALMVDVTYARATLVARGDRTAFAQTLRGVLAADVARWPARRAANELARRKAARYLAAIDQLFPL